MYLCMYTVSFSIECRYWSLITILLSRLLMKVHMWAFRDRHFLVPVWLCILRVRDKRSFRRDSGSLSSPSLHTLVIWPFSMTWFEWISTYSFSFDLFVPLMVFHWPCLHCSLFISIYIPCSIFSTHHSYASHQQFDILHLFYFIIDTCILDSFFLTNIFILDVLKSMVHEILYTYCIFTWGYGVLLLRLLRLVSLPFFHLITLAYVTS